MEEEGGVGQSPGKGTRNTKPCVVPDLDMLGKKSSLKTSGSGGGRIGSQLYKELDHTYPYAAGREFRI